MPIATVDNAWQMGDPAQKPKRKARPKSHICGNIMGSGDPCGAAYASATELHRHRVGRSGLGASAVRKQKPAGCNAKCQTVVEDQVRAPQGFWAGFSVGRGSGDIVHIALACLMHIEALHEAALCHPIAAVSI